MGLSRIVKAILDNENSILTVSTYLKDGEYGQDDIYIGVPAIVNSKGVRELLTLELNEEEQSKLDESCKILKDMRNKLEILKKLMLQEIYTINLNLTVVKEKKTENP